MYHANVFNNIKNKTLQLLIVNRGEGKWNKDQFVK